MHFLFLFPCVEYIWTGISTMFSLHLRPFSPFEFSGDKGRFERRSTELDAANKSRFVNLPKRRKIKVILYIAYTYLSNLSANKQSVFPLLRTWTLSGSPIYRRKKGLS